MNRTIQVFAVVVAIATVTAAGGVAIDGLGAAANQHEASVTIDDQSTDGSTIIVESVTVPEGGFVVIHDDSLAEGDAVGSVIGVSRYLGAGTHENVPVTVAPEFDTSDDIEVTAMPHEDTNDNEVYDFVTSSGEVDGPYTTVPGEAVTNETPMGTAMNETETPETNETETPAANETETPLEDETETSETNETGTPMEDGTETPSDEAVPVTDSATIDALSGDPPEMNLTFENQTTNGSTVTVQNVTLYRGGYLVIHENLSQDGAVESVVGHSAYLPPGSYEEVQITLVEPLAENESTNFTAMPHRETNDNLVYDFVHAMGTVDGPYTANDTPVTESATVTVVEETETPGMTETPEMNETTETPEMTETPETNATVTETESDGGL